ncbi:MAG: hypothetical protein V1736_08210 [Pseudomonadota bacterium]
MTQHGKAATKRFLATDTRRHFCRATPYDYAYRAGLPAKKGYRWSET